MSHFISYLLGIASTIGVAIALVQLERILDRRHQANAQGQP